MTELLLWHMEFTILISAYIKTYQPDRARNHTAQETAFSLDPEHLFIDNSPSKCPEFIDPHRTFSINLTTIVHVVVIPALEM